MKKRAANSTSDAVGHALGIGTLDKATAELLRGRGVPSIATVVCSVDDVTVAGKGRMLSGNVTCVHDTDLVLTEMVRKVVVELPTKRGRFVT